MSMSGWSTTPANNASVGNINMATGAVPSTVHPSVRQLMADVRSWYENEEWRDFGDVPTYATASSFTIPTDVTARYHANRRIQCNVGGTMYYGTISSSTYSASNTTVNVTLDSGALTVSLTNVAVGISALNNTNLPTNLTAVTATNATNATNVTGTIASGVTATTQSTSDNSTKVATTALVQNVAGNIQQFSLATPTLSSNAMTVYLNPSTVSFRNATLGTGGVTTLQNAAQLSLTIPSGATLGAINAVQARFMLLAINNAGTIELAVVNQSGGVDLSGTGLINTTAISAAATSASTIYSANARTGVPYQVVGYVENTQATAGTYVTAPSLVQGATSTTLGMLQTVGNGQTWQNVTGSRALGTTYYNTTGRAFVFNVQCSGSGVSTTMTINGVSINAGYASSTASSSLTGIVPAGGSYSSTGGTLSLWAELR